MSVSRFDLEEDILDTYQADGDIQNVRDMITQGELTDLDVIDELLMSIQQLHVMRCDKAFNTFEQLLDQGDIQ